MIFSDLQFVPRLADRGPTAEWQAKVGDVHVRGRMDTRSYSWWLPQFPGHFLAQSPVHYLAGRSRRGRRRGTVHSHCGLDAKESQIQT